MNVNSTYRTYIDNLNWGGATHSQHLTGEAEDLQTGPGTAAIQADIESKGPLYQSLRSACIGGFGIGVSFIHLDTRKSGNSPDQVNGSYALWYYAGVKKNFNSIDDNDTTTDNDETPAVVSKNMFYLLIVGIILLLV